MLLNQHTPKQASVVALQTMAVPIALALAVRVKQHLLCVLKLALLWEWCRESLHVMKVGFLSAVTRSE